MAIAAEQGVQVADFFPLRPPEAYDLVHQFESLCAGIPVNSTIPELRRGLQYVAVWDKVHGDGVTHFGVFKQDPSAHAIYLIFGINPADGTEIEDVDAFMSTWYSETISEHGRNGIWFNGQVWKNYRRYLAALGPEALQQFRTPGGAEQPPVLH